MSDQNVDVGIGIVDGKVVLQFQRKIDYLTLDCENAIQIASAMTDAAFETRDGVKPVGSTLKAELVERHRMKLTQRYALMLSSLRDDKLKTNGQLAKALIDAAFQEIF